MGGDSWGESQYADAAMYIASPSIISDMLRSSREKDWTDADVEGLLKSYLSDGKDSKETSYSRKVHVVGGDYFSIEEYEQVRRSDDNVF